FVFSMLALVLANNFIVLYLGWELVGLCSYLLIAFWFERKTAADAGKKAFIVTRIGDTAMLIGIFLIFAHFGSVDFDRVLQSVDARMPSDLPHLGGGAGTAIALLLFAGAIGKSAQVPLHTWLPDAIEGPTPVSALIHAATMVTAGVYLVVRTHVIFEASPVALGVVAIVGLVTAVYAGLTALAQDDLKRVLAYSTISQLGYMFVAAGVGAYAVAIFHLVSHAFFKALLFLAAGSVMHATDEIDMTRLGGLRRQMPVTAALFAVGGLALAGIPLLVGFFSKDQVLAAAYEAGRTGIWIVGLIAAGLTAIYITRAFAMTFTGEPRHTAHPHEAPALMRWPMVALGALTFLGGLLGASIQSGRIQTFLGPVFGEAEHGVASGGLSELSLSIVASLVALAGIGIGWFVYGSGRLDWQRLRERFAGTKRTLETGFYLDDLYGRVLVLPGKTAASFAAFGFDSRVIDGAVNGIGRGFAFLARVGRRVQTGVVRSYALAVLAGAVGVLLILVARS
ncbi:MAG: NADH-quinone oxidoreductase subunit L, partial [Actinomycetota bacterium]|nr:NADH-quinone oxidoreductase subunit L [Actinomycetota bacterium]